MAFTFPKPLEFIPSNTKIPFVAFFKACFSISIILNVATVVLLVTMGLNFGIDFRGGVVLNVSSKSGPADIAQLRSKISALGFGETQIQQLGKPEDVLIRVAPEKKAAGAAEQQSGDELLEEVRSKVMGAIGDSYTFVDKQFIGGTVSEELLSRAVLALALTCAGIFTYVWFRFEWQFALGAIVALVHDVFVTVGVFSVFQFDFDLTIVAALLTILGYSINDTVVIYDRIRENLRKFKKMPLGDLIDLSVNETLSRTIMTVSTTSLALLALYFLGGPVIAGFTFAMLFGMFIGTYSSVFIAAPFLIMIGINRDWSGTEAAGTRKSRSTINA